ncbi:MAG: hypothetical protein Ta2A_02640 [Treponemataceae bacterium]|nr:MAG: hypothetical protein Ta2A_02640 [Treponemataceae bacterium]
MKKINTFLKLVFCVVLFFIAKIEVFAQDNSEFPYEFVSLSGDIYYEFNKNEGPDQAVLSALINKLTQHGQNKDSRYNDMYVSLLNSITYSNSNTDLAFQSILNVMQLSINKYNMYFISPYWNLMLGELFLRYADYENALGAFQDMKELHLNKISFDNEEEEKLLRVRYSDEPTRLADFYIAYCNDKIKNTNKNSKALERKYPNFWRIKL